MSTHMYKAGERRFQEIVQQRPPRGSAAEHQEFLALKDAFRHILRVLGGTSFEVRFTRQTGILLRTYPPEYTRPVNISIVKQSLGGEQE